mmetsp:Transcript_55661/g.155130  ORF Transcript_55661/g.155130 Transcript_55661/m.155130 type:complete len:242 (-) Transcript_55661:226-951(-)
MPATMHSKPTPGVVSKRVGFVRPHRDTTEATRVSCFARGCSLDISAEPMAHQRARSASARTIDLRVAASVPGGAKLNAENFVVAASPSTSAPALLAEASSSPRWNHFIFGADLLRCSDRSAAVSATRRYSSTSRSQSLVEDSGQNAATLVTWGTPIVRVPVLSITKCVVCDPSSRGTPPFFTNTPCFAATPVAVITAVGVARPRAHGQATNKTVRPCSRTKKKRSNACHSEMGRTRTHSSL